MTFFLFESRCSGRKAAWRTSLVVPPRSPRHAALLTTERESSPKNPKKPKKTPPTHPEKVDIGKGFRLSFIIHYLNKKKCIQKIVNQVLFITFHSIQTK
jgi:hypothetical protein